MLTSHYFSCVPGTSKKSTMPNLVVLSIYQFRLIQLLFLSATSNYNRSTSTSQYSVLVFEYLSCSLYSNLSWVRNSKWNIFWDLNEKEQIKIYDLAEMNIESGKQQKMSMNSIFFTNSICHIHICPRLLTGPSVLL